MQILFIYFSTRSVLPVDAENEGKKQETADIEMVDVEIVESKSRSRKTKCEIENQEPVKKKPRNANEAVAVDGGGIGRKLRSRTGHTNYTDDAIHIIDNKKDPFEKDLEKALKESLKGVVTDETINLVENPDEKAANKKKKKKENAEPLVDPYAHIDKTIELLRYPSTHVFEPNAGEIIVKMEDFLCLGKAEYLSDVIIDFYLNYIYREKFTDELREKVYIFPSQLYSIYSTSASYAGWTSKENAGKSAPEKRYERIQGMLDASVNIFDKEFLVFPLFNHEHWFLSIVCFPKLQNSVTFEDNTPVLTDFKRNVRKKDDEDYNPTPLKTSCILTFDSVKSNSARRSSAMIHIRHFLKSHWEKNYKDQFPLGELISCSVQSPVQTNNVDCGCFLLEFVERFFVSDPMKDFRLPIFKKKWFNSEDVRLCKRREITEVIRQKMQEKDDLGNQAIAALELPELHFYSEHLAIDIIDIPETSNGNEELNNNNNDLNCLDNNDAETHIPPASPILFETEEIVVHEQDDFEVKEDDEDEVQDPHEISRKKNFLCIRKGYGSPTNEEDEAGLSEIPTMKLENSVSDKKSSNDSIKVTNNQENSVEIGADSEEIKTENCDNHLSNSTSHDWLPSFFFFILWFREL